MANLNDASSVVAQESCCNLLCVIWLNGALQLQRMSMHFALHVSCLQQRLIQWHQGDPQGDPTTTATYASARRVANVFLCSAKMVYEADCGDGASQSLVMRFSVRSGNQSELLKLNACGVAYDEDSVKLWLSVSKQQMGTTSSARQVMKSRLSLHIMLYLHFSQTVSPDYSLLALHDYHKPHFSTFWVKSTKTRLPHSHSQVQS